MSEDNQKQNWKKNQNWNAKKEESKYQKNYKYVNPKKEEGYQKQKGNIPEQLQQFMKQYPDCFSEKKIPLSEKITIPMDECLLKIIKNDQKMVRKKSDQYKNNQEKRFEKYQKKEPYENKNQQLDNEEKEPEWMQSNLGSMDLNDFQMKTLEYDYLKSFGVKKDISQRMEQNTNDELFADVDQNLEQHFKQASPKAQQQQEDSDNSSDNEISFQQLLEKSQKRNSIDAPKKVEAKTLESTVNYTQLEIKCSTIYAQNKEYNKIKLFIDFTRQMTKLDINENTWYYQDPQKKIQGPFSSVDMDVWNLDQYFPSNLQISWKQNKNFISIQQFKENPIQILKMAYMNDQNILDILQVDKKEIKKPQGFENYNNQTQELNVQIFSTPNYQITTNNFQISQNNYQIPFFNQDNKNPIDIQKSFNQFQKQAKPQSNPQPQMNPQFNILSQQSFTQNQPIQQPVQSNQKQNKKQPENQAQPQLLSDLQVLNELKQDNFQNISEGDLKKLLGIQKEQKNFY